MIENMIIMTLSKPIMKIQIFLIFDFINECQMSRKRIHIIKIIFFILYKIDF